jgi:hypothetical protein
MTSAHSLVAQACLGILLHLDENVTTDSLDRFPLAKYAAEHRLEHVHFEGVSQDAEEGITEPSSPVETPYIMPLMPIQSRYSEAFGY